MDRREFLLASGTYGAAFGLSAAWGGRSWGAAHQPLGLQLFTVMVQLEADFEGTLKSVADTGYREVETIGTFGRDPKKVRDLLDKHGLVSPSQHLVPGHLYDVFLRFTRKQISYDEIHALWLKEMTVDKVTPIIEEGIARAKIMGQQYLVWQILWPEQMQTRPAVDAFCRALDTAGSLCAKAGLTFNFHNHSDEFKPREGFVPYQVILDTTDPKNVKFELDVYWAIRAGRDPIDYLTRYSGRYVQLHLKDATASGDFATVGKGVIDFPPILRAARAAGIKHYYVEYDRSDDPMAVTREAFAYLNPLM